VVTNLPGRSLHRCEAGSKDLRTLRRNFLRRRIVEQLRGGCAGHQDAAQVSIALKEQHLLSVGVKGWLSFKRLIL